MHEDASVDVSLELPDAVHHTKDKGDLGTAKAHADLAAHGFMVLFPATEHAADRKRDPREAVRQDAGGLLCIYCPETDRCYYVRPPADEFRAVPSPQPDTPGDLPVDGVPRQQDVARPRHV